MNRGWYAALAALAAFGFALGVLNDSLHKVPTLAAACVGLLVFGILKVLAPEPGPYEDD